MHFPNTAASMDNFSNIHIQTRSQGEPKGALPPPAKAECTLANVNRLQKNFGLRNVNVYVKITEVHVKSKGKKENATV
jgi:hypothetical protein